MNSIGSIHKENILLLQGPVGFFFKKLDKNFRAKGAKTYRIGLNAGDEFFSYKENYTGYRGKPKEWESFIVSFLKEHTIHKVFLFGDCRFYQSITVKIAMALKIEVFVFEEGYIRPNYLTLERYGVNSYSRVPRNSQFYFDLKEKKIEVATEVNFNPLAQWAEVVIYYFVARLFHLKYKDYQHHRNFSAVEEFFYGVRSLLRKALYKRRDKKYLKLIEGKLSQKYFFVPLQTHNDFQILQHSDYGSIETFISEVLESFAKDAPKETLILFKHHPLDRGRKNYTQLICEQAKALNIENRVFVVHDVYLPSCLRHAKGTVTINSTVGLSSLYHETPTLTLGNAIYDIDKLTNKNKTLKDFWKKPLKPNMKLLKKFRQYLIETTQLNGSFYGRMPDELSK